MGAPDFYERLVELVRRHTVPSAPVGSDLTPYEFRLYSQNGEDGVLAEILQRIGPGSKEFVEFGVETGVEGNCVALADVLGWSGLFIEGDQTYAEGLAAKYSGVPRVRTLGEHVTPENINDLLASSEISSEPDVLSIDVDGNDLWIWQAITLVRPRVVVIEYNATLDPERPLVQPYDPDWAWSGTDWFGASLSALEQVGTEKGYRLVHTDLTGVNAFFVLDDLAGPFHGITAPRRAANYFGSGRGHPEHPNGGRYIELGND